MPDAVRRSELRDFLRSRRGRISPAAAGLPDAARSRRTPGLRREEVAVLAGVGPSWYQWLEQGRAITVSPQVLDAVAHVLEFDDAERRHLYALAGLNPPLPDLGPRLAHCAGFHRLLDSWAPYPATILDQHWNIVAWNEPARLTLDIAGPSSNYLTGLFLDEGLRRRLSPWDEVAAATVASFRSVVAEQPADEQLRRIVEDLLVRSPDFARLWAGQDIAQAGMVTYHLEHPVLGTVSFESSHLRLPARPDVTLVLHNPVPDTATAEKLRHLAALDAAPDGIGEPARGYPVDARPDPLGQ